MKKYTLYQFGAEWCNPCKIQRDVFENCPLEGAEYKFIDCDEDENEPLIEQYGIVDLPTMILFEDSAAIETWHGLTPRDTIQQYIDERRAINK